MPAPIPLLCLVLLAVFQISAATDPSYIDHLDFPEHLTRVKQVHANINSITHQAEASTCGKICDFSMCSFNFNGAKKILPNAPFTILSAARRAAFPYICRNGTLIGQIISKKEVRVQVGSKYVPISGWKPEGLDVSFPRNFIRPSQIAFTPWSGISRVATAGNQWNYLHDRCMILPIGQYETLNPKRLTAKPKILPAPISKSACVAFRTSAPVIQVELIWDSGDDFDVHVVEPDGDRIYYGSDRSESGMLDGDITSSCSSSLKFGRENVLYLPGSPIERGTYTVRVQQFSNCNRTPTSWRLTVLVDGVIRLRQRGISTIGNNEVVAEGRFDYL